MRENENKFSFVDNTGQRQEVVAGVEDYREALDRKVSLSELYSVKFPADKKQGSTFDQFMANAGMFLAHDKDRGVHPPTMKQVMEGNGHIATNAIVRPDGAARHTPSGRILFPEVILRTIESALYGDEGQGFIQAFNSAVAQTTTVNSALVDQPLIDTSDPRAARVQPIEQLAEPAAMVTIKTLEKPYRIPTKSIGLVISDQAMEAATLDLVALSMQAQALAQAFYDYETHLNDMVNGSVDAGSTALAAVTAVSFDATIAAPGQLTHRAWIKYLYSGIKNTRSISHIFCDIDTALTIETRQGRPTVSDDAREDTRIDAIPTVNNLSIAPPQLIITDPTVLGANRLVGVDRRYAIRQLVNASASYEATEAWVMRRSTGFRVDSGVLFHRLYDQAWSVMDLIP